MLCDVAGLRWKGIISTGYILIDILYKEGSSAFLAVFLGSLVRIQATETILIKFLLD